MHYKSPAQFCSISAGFSRARFCGIPVIPHLHVDLYYRLLLADRSFEMRYTAGLKLAVCSDSPQYLHRNCCSPRIDIWIQNQFDVRRNVIPLQSADYISDR